MRQYFKQILIEKCFIIKSLLRIWASNKKASMILTHNFELKIFLLTYITHEPQFTIDRLIDR